jgi:putative membrane-bound dehydrogenase-like protein
LATDQQAEAEEGDEWEPNAPLPFRVPDGYVAERVAGPPLIKQPMFACFDDRGRLYVAGSSGEQLDARARLANPPDVIRCLEDTDGDGRFDKSTVFADRLTYPQGVLWHNGAVYTASAPSLWRLQDTDGDGVADRRDELVTGFPFTGIADDLHGPSLGPDGRLYWGVGRFDYAIRKPGGPVIRRGRTPLIMRCRPDGEEVEVFSAAMGNPVEAAFSAEGEPFACGTFLSPEVQGAGLRDALIHCVFGGLYSVRDRDLAGETRTGDLLPPLAQLGVAAASGVTRARGGPFGDDNRLSLYSALFNLHSVARHVLRRDGATFRAREEPFLVSDVADFHPTDVLEDADGSLLVVDTGGWFRHCPTSQIIKSHVQGSIYRVRRLGAPRDPDPRGKSIDWYRQTPVDLARLLEDTRFAVRDQATDRLAAIGEPALRALRDVRRTGSARARLHAVWALARISGERARQASREALADRDHRVRLAAAVAAGLSRDQIAVARLRRMARFDAPPVRREAATALGRIGRPEAVAGLLDGLRRKPDRFLEHAMIYALIQIDDSKATLAGLSDPSPLVRRGALIALNQMAHGGLTLDQVTPLFDTPDPELLQAALKTVADHPDWAGPMAGTLRRWLASGVDKAQARVFKQQLLAFARDPAVQGVIADAVASSGTPPATRTLLLDVMAEAPIGPWPRGWVNALGRTLEDRDQAVVRQAVAAVRMEQLDDHKSALLRIARDEKLGDDLRVEALDAVAPGLLRLDAPLFDFLVNRLGENEPPVRRMSAARALGEAPLGESQLLALIPSVAGAGALILPRLLPAYARSDDPHVGTELVAALEKAPGQRAVRPEALREAVENYPQDVQHRAESLLRRLETSEADKAKRLAELAPLLSQGDPRRGREVFFGRRATCSTCHTVRGEGGHVGPDLTRIGEARNGQDLLEAVLYPSASFARGYEPFVVATEDGRVQTGVVVRETGDSIVLVTPDRKETSIPRSSIEAIELGRVSVMPQGLEANVSRQELVDLIAFLRSLQ